MLTKKREVFAIELFKGGVASDAYRTAFPNKMTNKQIWEESSKLSRNPMVTQRVRELRQQVVDKVVIDKKFVTEGILRNIEAAEAKEDGSVALKGYDMLGKMYDLNDDKQNDRLFTGAERQALVENYKRRLLDVTPD